jgi:hypothetical protein
MRKYSRKYDRQISFMGYDQHLNAFKEYAEKHGTSVSHLIRKSMEMFIDQEIKKE